MESYSYADCAHMARALQLAARGRYTSRPNPVVGCVIVNHGVVVGEGWHERAGQAHAEVNALKAAGEQARGATVYLTLEPCAHHGRTPPCAEALVRAGAGSAIVAMRDPFSEVAGRGIEALQAAGIETRVGLMEAEAETLNEGFVSRVTRGRPFVRLKVAASIDGGIAMQNGESQWITGPQARDDVQRLRAHAGAILTGIGTVLTDDPSLNVRAQNLADDDLQPLRVVLDTHLRMPPASRMLSLPGRTLVCCSGKPDDESLREAGAEVLACPADGAVVDVAAVLGELAGREINDVLVEAGPCVSGRLIEKALVDELVIYQAPHIMGSETRRMFETPSLTVLADRKRLTVTDVRRLGDDTRIRARLVD